MVHCELHRCHINYLGTVQLRKQVWQQVQRYTVSNDIRQQHNSPNAKLKILKLPSSTFDMTAACRSLLFLWSVSRSLSCSLVAAEAEIDSLMRSHFDSVASLTAKVDTQISGTPWTNQRTEQNGVQHWAKGCADFRACSLHLRDRACPRSASRSRSRFLSPSRSSATRRISSIGGKTA